MSTIEVAPETAPTPLSDVVVAIRRATGLTQNGVARRARVNQGLLSALLSGKAVSRPAERRIRRLAGRLAERLQKAGKLDGQRGEQL
jgi:transcriptional regulator with XRE-family HTH domain